jgi:probable F420-dependent oxidoreductase
VKFGLRIPMLYEPQAADPFLQTYVLCQAAEKAGFDFVSLTHHSFSPECQSSAPFVVLAAIAARTSTLRLATVIYILPLHHPVAVAEQVATLDNISGGRAILGVGVGYRDYEFVGFGLNSRHRGARADESMAVIRQGWLTGRYNHQGMHFQIPDLPAVPMPVQKPHPPMWVGGLSDAALKRGARLGDGWVSDNMQMLSQVSETAGRYRALCAAQQTKPFVCVARNAWVADTRDDVIRDWYGWVIENHLSYRRAGYPIPDPEGIYERLERQEAVGLEEFTRDRAIAGTPVDCVAQLQRWRAKVDCQAMLLLLNEEAGYDKMLATIELFGREVFPTLDLPTARD